MKYEFTNEQINEIVNALDIATKTLGISGIYKMLSLANIIDNPIDRTDDKLTYDIKEDEIKGFIEVLDIALKSDGIKSIYKTFNLINIFSNPIQENNEDIERV